MTKNFVKLLMFIDILNTVIDNIDFHDIDLFLADCNAHRHRIRDQENAHRQQNDNNAYGYVRNQEVGAG